MQIRTLSQNNSLLLHFVNQLRCVEIQKDSMRFRRNIERIGEIMAYEISKELAFKPVEIQTPLGIKSSREIQEQPVIISILRAGLTLHNGFLNYFDQAANGFVSAYRHHYNNDDAFDIKVEYQAIPSLDNRILLMVDPMLATGQSLVAVFKQLMEKHTPSEIHIAAVIAAPEGIDYLKEQLPDTVNLWIADVDTHLNAKNYIVPGLGDAGDLAYGVKL